MGYRLSFGWCCKKLSLYGAAFCFSAIQHYNMELIRVFWGIRQSLESRHRLGLSVPTPLHSLRTNLHGVSTSIPQPISYRTDVSLRHTFLLISCHLVTISPFISKKLNYSTFAACCLKKSLVSTKPKSILLKWCRTIALVMPCCFLAKKVSAPYRSLLLLLNIW